MLRGKYRVPFYMSTDCENILRRFLVLNPAKRCTLEVRGPGVAQLRRKRRVAVCQAWAAPDAPSSLGVPLGLKEHSWHCPSPMPVSQTPTRSRAFN